MPPEAHELPPANPSDFEPQNLLDTFLHISEAILELTQIPEISDLLQQILKKSLPLMESRGSAIGLRNEETGTFFPLKYDGIDLTPDLRKALQLESRIDAQLFEAPRYRISEELFATGNFAHWKMLELPIGNNPASGGALFLFFAKIDDIPKRKIKLLQCYCNLVFSTIRSTHFLQQSREQAAIIERSHRKQEAYNDALANANVRAVDLIADAEQAHFLADARAKELALLNEKLVEASRLKSEFLANMSHELRTPLNSIIGFSSMLLKEIDGPLLPEQRDSASFIQSSGKHLLELINGILDLSKIEAGHMELNIEPTNPMEIVQNAIQTVEVLFRDRGLYLTSHLESNLPLIDVDPTRFRQIVVNMLGNAAKFTKKGGASLGCSVVMSDSNLLPANLVANNPGVNQYLLLSVEDTGCGIKEDNFEKVFDKFRQIDGSSTREQGGTGLGMAISKQIAHLHHGEIWIQSAFGKGSTFFVALPLTHEHHPTPAPADEHRPETSVAANNTHAPTAVQPDQDRNFVSHAEQLPVFIVDDDPQIIAYYKKCMEGSPFRPIAFMAGENIGRNAAVIQPRAILLDIMLPDKDGWAILQELKGDPETQHIPVIIGSSLHDQQMGARLGAADYLVKPINAEVLLESLKKNTQLAVKL